MLCSLKKVEIVEMLFLPFLVTNSRKITAFLCSLEDFCYTSTATLEERNE